MKTIFLIINIVLSFSKILKAQTSEITKDTIYYLADTAKVPVKDRIVEIGIELPFRCYAILFKCLKYDQRPVFICNVDEPNEVVDSMYLKKVQLISVVNLVELAKDAGGEAFNYKHIAYIFEPDGKKYIKRKVRLLKPMRHDITY